ncbi:MAG: hypothetical protein JWP06_139 [Candidatus Saccharibacteria bacterium]|nr:hypothetical protein [Candidatus Saccharibacteria bacterium]
MQPVATLGAAIFAPADGTALIGSITTMITDNLPGLLVLIGFGVGFAIFRKMLNKSHKGKI